jgi:drug/metabolite transporter (DMT)-like permease
MGLGARNRLLVLAAALLFSTGGAAIKAATLTSWQVACFRSGVAAVAMLALVPVARRGWNRRVIPVGAAYAATLVLFVLANKLTTAANTIFLQSTAPLYLLVLGPVLLREPVRRSELAFMSALAAGLALVFAGAESAVVSAPDPLGGKVLAALSGVAYACTLAGLRWLGKGATTSNPAAASVVAGNLIAFLGSLPMALPVVHLGTPDLLVILYLGIFQIGLAYWCLTRAMRYVPALSASLLLLVEPALNPVWAWLAQGERPGPWALAGGALILAATAGNTWWQSRR